MQFAHFFVVVVVVVVVPFLSICTGDCSLVRFKKSVQKMKEKEKKKRKKKESISLVPVLV